MRAKQRWGKNSSNPMPEINLVPMMDVMMTILTFFIIISMTLTGQQILNISLPATEGGAVPGEQGKTPPQKLVVGLTGEGKIALGDKTITSAELTQEVVTFLTEHPNGIVMLKADRQLDFKEVSSLLKKLSEIGGDRVYLGIEREAP